MPEYPDYSAYHACQKCGAPLKSGELCNCHYLGKTNMTDKQEILSEHDRAKLKVTEEYEDILFRLSFQIVRLKQIDMEHLAMHPGVSRADQGDLELITELRKKLRNLRDLHIELYQGIWE